jgi:hypothetical protein
MAAYQRKIIKYRDACAEARQIPNRKKQFELMAKIFDILAAETIYILDRGFQNWELSNFKKPSLLVYGKGADLDLRAYRWLIAPYDWHVSFEEGSKYPFAVMITESGYTSYPYAARLEDVFTSGTQAKEVLGPLERKYEREMKKHMKAAKGASE